MVVEDAALERRRMDLVKVEILAQDCTALLDLPPQRRQRVILHLVHAGIDPPITDVCVAPFRSNRDRLWWEPTLAKPGSQEAFGEAVGARRIEITNARVVGGVEHFVRPALQRVDAAVGADVVFPTERDVAGTSDGGQPQADRRDLEPGGAEGAERHPGRSGY